MKRAVVMSLGLLFGGAQFACMPAESTPPAGSGGAVGSGGAQANSGGAPGSGGAIANSGGAPGTGGAVSSGGAQGNSGGATGNSGGAQGQTGGSGAGTGGAAGGSTGSGGRGTGGAAGGGTASGGAMGAGGAASGGSSGLPDVPTLFPAMGNLGSLDGRMLTMPCVEANGSGTDCKPGGYYTTAGSSTAQKIDCQGSSFTLDQVFPVAGEAGKTYKVTIHVYGIAEPKNYGNATRDAGTGRPGNQDTGAMPTSWATAPGGHTFTASDYNTYEIRSCKTRTCAAADETNVYYLNADTSEGHWTYVMNYEKQITVTGGGAVRVRNYDRNCRQIKNCGTNGTPNSSCPMFANNRRINVSAAMPTPAASFAPMGGLTQPQLISERDAGNAGQWLLIDVVKVDSVM